MNRLAVQVLGRKEVRKLREETQTEIRRYEAAEEIRRHYSRRPLE